MDCNPLLRQLGVTSNFVPWSSDHVTICIKGNQPIPQIPIQWCNPGQDNSPHSGVLWGSVRACWDGGGSVACGWHHRLLLHGGRSARADAGSTRSDRHDPDGVPLAVNGSSTVGCGAVPWRRGRRWCYDALPASVNGHLLLHDDHRCWYDDHVRGHDGDCGLAARACCGRCGADATSAAHPPDVRGGEEHDLGTPPSALAGCGSQTGPFCRNLQLLLPFCCGFFAVWA